MKSFKTFLTKYTALLVAFMKPLGIWGAFLTGFLDSAFIGPPGGVDAIVATYVYTDRTRMILYIVMASAGSSIGSLVMYWIGYKGGNALLRKRMSPERLQRIEAAFSKRQFLALMIPAMLPPPTPFKLFELAAAAFEMPVGKFLLSIFTGRCIRFLVISLFTLYFGPQFVHWSGALFHHHFKWIAAVVVLGVVIWFLLARKKPGSLEAEVAETISPQ